MSLLKNKNYNYKQKSANHYFYIFVASNYINISYIELDLKCVVWIKCLNNFIYISLSFFS